MKITRTITFEDDEKVIKECQTGTIMGNCQSCATTAEECIRERNRTREFLKGKIYE